MAGTMGMMQAWRMLHSRAVPPIVHLRVMSSHVAFPLANPHTLGKVASYRAGGALPPARGYIGTSSFGFSGTNAHALLSPNLTRSEIPAGFAILQEAGEVRVHNPKRYWVAPRHHRLLTTHLDVGLKGRGPGGQVRIICPVLLLLSGLM